VLRAKEKKEKDKKRNITIIVAVLVIMIGGCGICAAIGLIFGPSHPLPSSTSANTNTNVIVGTWTNGDAGRWLISYTFNTDGSMTYTTGAVLDTSMAGTYKGTWNDAGYINNPGENTVGEDYTLTANPTDAVNGDTTHEVIQSLLLYNGKLTIFTSDGISEPADTVMTKQ
jgi:hypothetical protein